MSSAGGSAQKEYEHLRAVHRFTADRRAKRALLPLLFLAAFVLVLREVSLGVAAMLGCLGSLAAAREVWSLPQAIKAWAKGAAGERATAAGLAKVEKRGYRALHDRKIPGSEANIDHIVIGPGGIFVVETKNYRAKISIGRQTIFVSGKPRTDILRQAWREAMVVQTALAPVMAQLAIDVVPVVCFHGAEISEPGARVDGVAIVGRRSLLRLLKKAERKLSEAQVQSVAGLADTLLRPAADSQR